jgi:hypothetical protein
MAVGILNFLVFIAVYLAGDAVNGKIESTCASAATPLCGLSTLASYRPAVLTHQFFKESGALMCESSSLFNGWAMDCWCNRLNTTVRCNGATLVLTIT